jgi:aminopeptidase N
MAAREESGPYQLTSGAIGRRTLKNLCLAYLMLLETAENGVDCLNRLVTADNMTDRLAALTCLANSTLPQREIAMTSFYEQFRDNPLVVDKWFTVQASSSRADALAQVQRLLRHPDFALTNPNRVRALVGAFAHGNPARFHDPSGAGYAFLADQVLALDPLNPQVAARMVSALSRWRRYDGGRQGLMRAQLERIQAQAGLSRDVGEIVSKSLLNS